MGQLLWFHTFRRDDPGQVISVLARGPQPTPSALSNTSDNEKRLGLFPATYLYVGIPSEAFGDCCLALNRDAVEGTVSPFDTGGLLRHIAPANALDDANRKKLVDDYSWPTTELAGLLERYPADNGLGKYLRRMRPVHAGPHALWDGMEINIWAHEDNDWRAWTWEGRTNIPLSMTNGPAFWSCSPATFRALNEHVEQSANTGLVADFEALLDTYVSGGVSRLVTVALERQEAA